MSKNAVALLLLLSKSLLKLGVFSDPRYPNEASSNTLAFQFDFLLSQKKGANNTLQFLFQLDELIELAFVKVGKESTTFAKICAFGHRFLWFSARSESCLPVGRHGQMLSKPSDGYREDRRNIQFLEAQKMAWIRRNRNKLE